MDRPTAAIGIDPDPVGASLDALGAHLKAERWLLAIRRDKGWDMRRREPSHKDDLLLQVAEALSEEPGGHVYQTPELGHAGLRLATSGIDRLLALVAGPTDAAVVTFFENPNVGLTDRLLEDDMAGTLARMGASARATYECLARVGELRTIGAWLPTLGRLADGDMEEGAALRSLGEMGTGTTLMALRWEREHVDVSWAARRDQEWTSGSTRLRKASALKRDSFNDEQADTIAKLLGTQAKGPWRLGRAHGGTLLAVAGLIDDNESLDALASLFDASAHRGRETATARNNAMLTERARIAGVIHEGITQVLTNVAIQMEVLDQVMDEPATARKMVQAMRTAVLEALDSLRGAILELTPNAPEWTDLAGGLERFVGDFGSQWGLELTFEISGPPRDVDPDVVALVFAFVQEGVSNVRKHSGTQAAAISLGFLDETVKVGIADEGKGFDPTDRPDSGFRQHQGLQILRSRAQLAGGRLTIRSTPGAGTRMVLEVGS